MRLKLQLLFVLLFAIYTGQIKISGYKIPVTIKTQDHTLVLNGAGLREMYRLDIYVGALYVKEKSSEPIKLMLADEPMCMKIYVVSSLLTNEKLLESIDEGFKRSTDGNTIAIQPKINHLKSVFYEKLKKHDDFNIIYEPGKGSSVYKNGIHLTTIPGYEFKKALFGIWLSKNAAASDLKVKLLGN